MGGGWGRERTSRLREDVRSDFQEFTRASDDLVRDFTGLAPSQPVPDPIVLDRGGGVRANVGDVERRLSFTPRDFRFWITLHEVTHRTQFTGVPWLRDRVRALIESAIGGMELDPANVRKILERGKDLLMKGPSAWRSASLMSILMSDEQRALIDEMQALMCVVEGHGTFVMNRLGAQLIPTFESMRGAIEGRRGGRRGPEGTLQRGLRRGEEY